MVVDLQAGDSDWWRLQWFSKCSTTYAYAYLMNEFQKKKNKKLS